VPTTRETAAALSLSYPLDEFSVTALFGSNGTHRGVDLTADYGAPVYAVSGGTVYSVVSEGYNGGYGKTVILKHGDGDNALYTLYAHLSEISVTEGQTVGQRQQIGAVGISGVADGPLLYFEIRTADNQAIDPEGYLAFTYRVG